MRKYLCLLLCAAMLAALSAGCVSTEPEGPAGEQAIDAQTMAFSGGAYQLRTAVLCAPGGKDELLTGCLSQSTLLGLTATTLEAAADLALDGYDVLYLSPGLLTAGIDGLAETIMHYTENGGSVFVENSFYEFFPKQYLGAASFEKIEGCCAENLTFPEAGGDLRALQELVEDFASLYPSYNDYAELSEADYGWAMVPDTARPLVQWNGLTLYAVNQYGEGRVFFTNPLLPNRYSLGSFTMESEEGHIAPFANTTASFNQLICNAFAAYTAKAEYGYALERVFGYIGSPSISWELHFEEITGVANDALIKFSQLCEDNLQVPSYALVRSPYVWFLRAESVTYWLNGAEDGGYSFSMDYYEDAYSSGTHIAAGDQWLSLDADEKTESYFLDYPDRYTCRAYPAVLDYDHDGNADIFCGSRDGGLYYFRGTGFTDGRLKTEALAEVLETAGTPISCGRFSAPALHDLDGDGLTDLICGAGDGVLYWYKGNGSLTFAPQGELLRTDIPGQVLPAFCDVNGDGAADLAVGSDKGILMIYFGEAGGEGVPAFSPLRAVNLSRQCADEGLGHWLAPACTDWNGDGRADLLIGVYQGYVAVLPGDGEGNFGAAEYVSVGELNYKGNDYLKFGNFCSPALYDLDGDGRQDLLCGGQEYGLVYPIDCEYFAYGDELRRQLEYAREHDYYVGVHLLTGVNASAEQEAYELAAHLKAMEAYGIDTSSLGVNHHTWYTSSLTETQTLESIWNAGLLWESGFSPAGVVGHAPQIAAENVVALPFFWTKDGEERLLIQNNSVIPYTNEEWYALSAKYRMPVCIYYHCDFVYESDAEGRATAQTLSEFQWANGYNFNREDQMIKASAAVYHQNVDASGYLLGEEGLTISPAAPETDYPLYDADIQRSLGVRIALAEGIDPDQFAVEANVWFRDENAIVAGLDRPVTIVKAQNWTEPSHLTQVNIAAQIDASETGATIRFLSGGMMQAVVSGSAVTTSAGWTVTEQNGRTVFTKFGTGETLELQFADLPDAAEITGENKLS